MAAQPEILPVPRAADRLSDPAYVRFMWERYLQQEVRYARAHRRRTITISLGGAEELAAVLTLIRKEI